MVDIKNIIEKEKKFEVEEPEKKKRGRPPGSVKSIKKDETVDVKKEFCLTLESFSNTFLDIIEKRLPNPVPFSIDERKMFSKSVSSLGEKYFSVTGSYDVEISFILASTAIFYPRLKKLSKKKKEHK